MKLNIKLLMIYALCYSVNTLTYAAEKTTESKAAPAMSAHHGMGMWSHGLTDEEKEEHLKAMQEHSLAMHALSNQILAEKDPAKQEQLKVQQRELMKAHFEKMRQAHKM